MISVSAHRIVDRKNRALALMVHYPLKACHGLYGLARPRPAVGNSRPPMSRVKNALLLRIDGLGDVAMTAPVFGSTRELFPGARVTLLAASWSRGLVEVMPGIDEIIYFDAPWMVKGRQEKRESVLSLIRRLREERFDLAVDFRGDFRNNILMSLVNAVYRVGFDITGCGFLLTHVVPCGPDHHPTSMCLAAAEYLKPGFEPRGGGLCITEEDREHAASLLEENGVEAGGDSPPVVLIHPGAKWSGRWWVPERYAEIGDRLAAGYGARVILTGAPSDSGLVSRIAGMMKTKAVVAAGKTTLRQFLALIERSSLFIGVDSGPMHMAAAMGARVVALFGPALAEAMGPYGDGHIVVTRQKEFSCSPCAQTACAIPDRSCMKAITAEDVWEAVKRQMDAILRKAVV